MDKSPPTLHEGRQGCGKDYSALEAQPENDSLSEGVM